MYPQITMLPSAVVGPARVCLFLTLVLQWYFLKRTLQLGGGLMTPQVYLGFCAT